MRRCAPRRWQSAHRIAAATGARLIAQVSNARIARGRGRLPVDRVPYVVDVAVKALAGTRHVILCGAAQAGDLLRLSRQAEPPIPADADIHVLARARAGRRRGAGAPGRRAGAPRGGDSRPRAAARAAARRARRRSLVAATLAALMPEAAIIADESVTFGRGFFPVTYAAPPHDWLQLDRRRDRRRPADGHRRRGRRAGAVGSSRCRPTARRCTRVQALWTQARERLDVTTVLLSNRKYQILLGELANVGANPGRTALDMLDLGNPDLDWVRLANGMGVEAARARHVRAFRRPVLAANGGRDRS